MHVIGLTGGIGTGKSTVAAVLAGLGATIISADELGHRAYASGAPAYDQILEAFGNRVRASDGAIDRKALGGIVFGSPEKLRQLNTIVHPVIRSLAEAELKRADDAGAQVAVVEAALLVDAGWHDLVDEVWVTTAPRPEVVRRIMERDGLSAGEVEKRMKAQLPDSERLAHADYVFETGTLTREALEEKVNVEWRRLVDVDRPAR